MLSKSNTQAHLVKQPRPIPKVVLEEAGASGKRRRCEWLQMRSSCCQRTAELEHLSSRAAEQNEDDRKRKRDPRVRRNIGFFRVSILLLHKSALTHNFTQTYRRFQQGPTTTGGCKLRTKICALAKGENKSAFPLRFTKCPPNSSANSF